PAWNPVVTAILGQEDARIALARQWRGPRDEPARNVGIAVEGDHRRSRRSTVADEETEELDTVRGAVRNTLRLDRTAVDRASRLEQDPFLVMPEHEEGPDVRQRRSASD